MSAKTKIIVLHMKEVIYTGIFLLLAVILAIVLFFMFGPGQKKSASADAKSLYKPGIYTSSIDLNENTFDLEVTVDSDRVTSIRLVNLSETLQPCFLSWNRLWNHWPARSIPPSRWKISNIPKIRSILP